MKEWKSQTMKWFRKAALASCHMSQFDSLHSLINVNVYVPVCIKQFIKVAYPRLFTNESKAQKSRAKITRAQVPHNSSYSIINMLNGFKDISIGPVPALIEKISQACPFSLFHQQVVALHHNNSVPGNSTRIS